MKDGSKLSFLLQFFRQLNYVEVIDLPIRKQTKTKKRKPSDFRGCISKDEATALLNSVEESRNEWEGDI